MLGAIAGDIIGSIHEGAGTKSRDFQLFVDRSRFTDDTVLTVAVAEAILDDKPYAGVFHDYVEAYPHAGYGGNFRRWALSRSDEPYGSWGNGSAMRVSPVGWARQGLSEVLDEARRSAAVSHDHPHGIRGAQATASAIFWARSGTSREQIRNKVEEHFDYDLSQKLEEIRPHYGFDVSCQGSVPQSIIAFLESTDFEGTLRNAISLGGDADTMAAIAGSIAEAYYGGVPDAIEQEVLHRLPVDFQAVIQRFQDHYEIG